MGYDGTRVKKENLGIINDRYRRPISTTYATTGIEADLRRHMRGKSVKPLTGEGDICPRFTHSNARHSTLDVFIAVRTRRISVESVLVRS